MTALKALYPPASMMALCLLGGYLLFWPLFILGVVFVFDLYGRTCDYLFLREKGDEYFTPRVLDRYGRSWCGRSLIVARNPNYAFYYRAMGYRWYHILPDGSFSKNSQLLKLSFWTSLSKGHKRCW